MNFLYISISQTDFELREVKKEKIVPRRYFLIRIWKEK